MLKVNLLGRFEVGNGGRPIEVAARPVQTLLAFLILNAGTAHRREYLAGLLWPESDEGSARHNLRQTLWRLRKAIGKDYLLSDRMSVSFDKSANYFLDVDALRSLPRKVASADERMQGLARYTGDLLPGFYDEWVVRERVHLQAIYGVQMRLLLDRLVTESRWQETDEWAERWLAHGEVPETAYRALMTAAAGLGDQAGVNAAYKRCVSALEQAYGVEPSSKTQALLHELTAEPSLPLTRPAKPTVLPHPASPFIGREAELNQIGETLEEGNHRLITIHGPGGIGKTRLAIEAARALAEKFNDGVCYVPLAGLNDPDQLTSNIASALALPPLSAPEAGQSSQGRLAEQLRDYLQQKHILLVLDNMEQLVEGAPLIAAMLEAGAGVCVLATSRERLNLRAEVVFDVSGLPFPEDDDSSETAIASYPAIKLFRAAALRAQPGFDLMAGNVQDIVAICRLVEGLPLGIELAAAWTAVLTPAEIAAEIRQSLDFLTSTLHDLPERQRSLRAVLASSWDHLGAGEQSIFAQLSIFRGGFTRMAAEKVGGASARDLLALTNKSLLRSGDDGRFQMHELLRQFGREKLQASGKLDATRDRHLAHFMQLAETAEPHLKRDKEPGPWLDRLADDHDNLRAALQWGQEADDQVEAGLRLAAAMDYFWIIRGHYEEGRTALAALLAQPQSGQLPTQRAYTLHQAAFLAWMQSDFAAVDRLAAKSMALWRNLGPDGRRGFAGALITSGLGRMGVGDFEEAQALISQGLSIMLEIEDERGVARALLHLGFCAQREGDYQQAIERFKRALPLLGRSGDSSQTAAAISGLAASAARLGDYERAGLLEEESLAMRRSDRGMGGIAISLGNLAWIAIRQDNLEHATALLLESLDLRRQILNKVGVAWCLERLAEISVAEGQRNAEDGRAAYLRAASLLGAAERLRSDANAAIDHMDMPEYEKMTAVLQNGLDSALLEQSWSQGRAMSLEKMIKLGAATHKTSASQPTT